MATGTLVLEGVAGLGQDRSVGLRLPKHRHHHAVADELGRQFTERDLRYMKMFADMAAIALTAARARMRTLTSIWSSPWNRTVWRRC